MTSTVKMVSILLIMLAINVGLSMFQGAVLEVNSSSAVFFDTASSPYSKYVQNDTLIVDDSYIPSDDDVEGDTSGNIISDTYKSIKSWVQSKLAPLNFVANLFRQPYGFFVDIGLPQQIALAIGVFWYLFALMYFVSWLMGR